MTIETTNQLALHQARQEQLVNSASYTKDYLVTLDPVKDYDHVACPTCGYQAVDYIFIKRGGATAIALIVSIFFLAILCLQIVS